MSCSQRKTVDRHDGMSLTRKRPGGQKGLLPGHFARDRPPAGVVVERKLPDDSAVVGPDFEGFGVLDDLHGRDHRPERAVNKVHVWSTSQAARFVLRSAR